jgi:predicted dehydrogenase
VSTGLRYGIVGTGLMGAEHIRNIRLLPGARITAIADPVPASLAAAREALGPAAVETFADAATLAEQADIDAVIVATPNHTHRAVLTPLFGRPIAILCEKPLGTTREDALWIAGQAARHPAPFWVGMEYRYMPPAAAFLRMLREGAIGRLAMLSIREHRRPFLPKVGDWNRFARNSGGTMVEKCCHFFDLMRLITGSEAVRVYCSGGQAFNHLDERYDGAVPDIIDNSFTIVDFANGMRAMLDLCMFAEGAEHQGSFTATGDHARLDLLVPPGELILSPREGPIERRHVTVDPLVEAAGAHHGATFYQHQAFARAVRGEGPVEVTAEDGLAAVLIGVAAEQSAREGRAITMAGLRASCV